MDRHQNPRGLGHARDRFAVVTDLEWISRTTKFMAMFMPMEGRVYPIAEAAKAREWISET